jgi:hypothetical protein
MGVGVRVLKGCHEPLGKSNTNQRLAREPMKEIVQVDKAPSFISFEAAGKQFLPIDTTTQILRLRRYQE